MENYKVTTNILCYLVSSSFLWVFFFPRGYFFRHLCGPHTSYIFQEEIGRKYIATCLEVSVPRAFNHRRIPQGLSFLLPHALLHLLSLPMLKWDCTDAIFGFIHILEHIVRYQMDFLVRHSPRELVCIALLYNRPDCHVCLGTDVYVLKCLSAQELLVAHSSPTCICVLQN